MNTALFNEDMTEEVKERISLANKKILKEKTDQDLHDVLWIFNDKQISSFYKRAWRYNENEVKALMKSYYICDIYTNYTYGSDILVILENKHNISLIEMNVRKMEEAYNKEKSVYIREIPFIMNWYKGSGIKIEKGRYNLIFSLNGIVISNISYKTLSKIRNEEIVISDI